MFLSKQITGLTGFLLSICMFVNNATAQDSIYNSQYFDSMQHANQQIALEEFSRADTVSNSAYWPHIKPALFFANIRKNIEFPAKINQGHSTNFCGYAAMTHLMLKYHPEIYLKHIISLYRTGTTALEKKKLDPSKEVREAAGALRNKGELDILHADQLWFLTLADQFKGYINFFDHKYNRGDENKIWAGTNYAKFNDMLRHFTKEIVTPAGTDFFRPAINDFYEYMSSQLNKGVVLLYVNSKFLYPHKFSWFKLRAPTHFIVLYEMYMVGDMIEIKYWDYGLKTEQQITKKRLRKLIFGISTISKR